jgi:hypothetical protein
MGAFRFEVGYEFGVTGRNLVELNTKTGTVG